MALRHQIKELKTFGRTIENFIYHGSSIFLKIFLKIPCEKHLGNVFHTEYLWFIFSTLIQHDLDRVTEEWNHHKIRKSNRTNVYGIPDELYLYPESCGYVQCGKNITDAEVNDILHY